MNGRVSKMLRKMRRWSKKDKIIWHELTPYQRSLVSHAHKTNVKLMHIDFLPKWEERI